MAADAAEFWEMASAARAAIVGKSISRVPATASKLHGRFVLFQTVHRRSRCCRCGRFPRHAHHRLFIPTLASPNTALVTSLRRTSTCTHHTWGRCSVLARGDGPQRPSPAPSQPLRDRPLACSGYTISQEPVRITLVGRRSKHLSTACTWNGAFRPGHVT